LSHGRIRYYGSAHVAGLGTPIGTSPLTCLCSTPLKAKSNWKQGDDSRTEYSVVGFVTLTVEAGTFKDICKIKKVVKAFDMQVYLYFAPNVGLIKEELINKNKSTTMFRELTFYKLD
jgi:hypothetical protein